MARDTRMGKDVGEILRGSLVYTCVAGSRAYGLAGPDSDTDLRGIYVPPARLTWGLGDVPDHTGDPARGADAQYWEVRHFLRMALAANPNVLECLWAGEYACPGEAGWVGERLRRERRMFLSARLRATYAGYARAEMGKIRDRAGDGGAIRWKHAMHLVRLLLAGIAACRGGDLLVDAGAHREELLAIRRGERPLGEVLARAERLGAKLEEEASRGRLPEHPDSGAAEAILLAARRARL